MKSLILGSAAAVLAVTGAQAADLPAAEPVEYVKVCDTFGTGFFYIPGTETCLKIGGYARYELAYLEPQYGMSRIENHTFTRARARLTFDARTMTEYGLLRSFIDIWPEANSGAGFTTTSNTRFWRAFVQFGGLTAGRAGSFFEFWGGYNLAGLSGVGGAFPVLPTNLLAYTFAFGNGFSATLSAEDATFYSYGYTGVAGVGGHTLPDVVASLRVDQGWGSAQIAGALHNNRFTTATTADSELGWAVMGGVTINLPMIAAGDQLSVQAVYADGATYYTGTRWSRFEGVNTFTAAGVRVGNIFNGDTSATTFRSTKAWSVAAGFVHNWTPQISTAITGTYVDVNNPNTVTAFADWDAYTIMLTNTYRPVAGLSISAEVAYENVDVNNVGSAIGVAVGDRDYWAGLLRIQRDF